MPRIATQILLLVVLIKFLTADPEVLQAHC